MSKQDEHARWIQSNGDGELRLNYPLDTDSIVFDLGGYKGEWSQKIFDKYQPNIYVFEPVEKFYNEIQERFSGNNKIKPFKFGLGNKSEEVKIGLSLDSSSVIKLDSQAIEVIKLESLVDFLIINNIDKVDLIKINIEGSEFDLLEDVLLKGKINTFVNIQVQFHDFVENSTERRNKIREQLSKTHELTYDFEFVWENWKKIN